ncbi:MAG TPA: preprotein translocase subunit SecE [Chitinophagales bacterium]|jgi:preprotein translocase subunit SecE|nr:preprotein translocase subunit SecE [Chitinophagales bacterium]
MNKIKAFISEAYQELRYKVSWPTWAELQSSTQLVLVAFLIISAVVFLMDLASKELLDLFYGLF